MVTPENQPATGDGGGLVRLRLDIAYDGTNFAGWATQVNQRTVAGVLGEAFTTIVGEPVSLYAAGRTDANGPGREPRAVLLRRSLRAGWSPAAHQPV